MWYHKNHLTSRRVTRSYCWATFCKNWSSAVVSLDIVVENLILNHNVSVVIFKSSIDLAVRCNKHFSYWDLRCKLVIDFLMSILERTIKKKQQHIILCTFCVEKTFFFSFTTFSISPLKISYWRLAIFVL